MQYYEFWEAVHPDGVLKQEANFALNSILNTEYGSNATAEHLGHLSNLVTQNQRQQIKPLAASNELISFPP